MLIPSHRAELEASGLTDDSIVRSGCYSATEAGVRDLLGFGAGPGLVFPYPELNGSGPYARVKLDRTPPDGKRYRSPKGQPNHLYVPPLVDRAALADPRVPLWCTEGEKKALKGSQEGLCCVAVPGVWSWKTRDARARSVPIKDLDAITWAGRLVYLVFDSDVAEKRAVRLAERALARELTDRGAIVRAVRLPAGADGATKVGLDDYLVTHSVETLCALDPVTILDPSEAAPTLAHDGEDYCVTWADAVTLRASAVRESSGEVHAEVTIQHKDVILSWGRLALASTAAREGLVRKLTAAAPRVGRWRERLEAACRLVVARVREGSPATLLVPRVRTGARYLLDPLAPIGETTVLVGDGGAGKGWLALACALCVSDGAELPGGLRAEVRGPVLYLDWESTEEELAERALRLAAGLGCRVRDLHYKAMIAPLAAALPSIRADVARLGAVAVVCDSLAPASGVEPEGTDAAVRTMAGLRALSPASRLVVAHVSKAAADGPGPARPFGSVFIQNLARSVWEVRRSDDETGDDLLLGLYHRKVNTGRKHRPLALRLHFEAEAITLATADLIEAPDLLDRTSLVHRLRTALTREPLSVEVMAERLGVGEDTVRRTLNRYRARRLFVPLADSKPQLWALGSLR